MNPEIRSPTGRGTGGRKRRRVEDEGGDRGGAAAGAGPGTGAVDGAEDGEAARAQVKLLACPYHKVFPDLYSRVKSCKAGYAKIHRLKEHIRRRHLRQRCWRCGAAFKKAAELTQHSAAPLPCDPVPEASWAYEQGFDLNQQQKLGFRCQNDEKDWRVLCTILFPRLAEARIPSPFCDESDDGSSLISYVQYADALRTSSDKLRRSLTSVIMAGSSGNGGGCGAATGGPELEDASRLALQAIEVFRRFEADDVYPGFMRRRSLETSLANSPQSCSDDDFVGGAIVAGGPQQQQQQQQPQLKLEAGTATVSAPSRVGEVTAPHRRDSAPNGRMATGVVLPAAAQKMGGGAVRSLDLGSAAVMGSLVAQAFWRPGGGNNNNNSSSSSNSSSNSHHHYGGGAVGYDTGAHGLPRHGTGLVEVMAAHGTAAGMLEAASASASAPWIEDSEAAAWQGWWAPTC